MRGTALRLSFGGLVQRGGVPGPPRGRPGRFPASGQMPVSFRTRTCTVAISFSTSAARPVPGSPRFTRKLAWRVSTPTAPQRRFLHPACSISAPANPRGGLRNVLPRLGSTGWLRRRWSRVGFGCGPDPLGMPGLEAEAGPYHGCRRQAAPGRGPLERAVAIGEVQVPCRQAHSGPLPRHRHFRRDQVLGGVAAVGAGVAHHGAAHGAGYADRPLQAGQALPDRRACQLCQGHAAVGPDQHTVRLRFEDDVPAEVSARSAPERRRRESGCSSLPPARTVKTVPRPAHRPPGAPDRPRVAPWARTSAGPPMRMDE